MDKVSVFYEALDQQAFEQAKRLYQEMQDGVANKDIDQQFWVRNHGVYLALAQADINLARQLAEQNKRLVEQMTAKELQHIAYHQLAMVEREAQHYELALAIIEQERDVIDSTDKLALSANAYEFAYLHFLLGHHAVAEQEMQKSLTLALESDDQVSQACAYRGLGEITAELSCFEKAKALFLHVNDEVGACQVDELMRQYASKPSF